MGLYHEHKTIPNQHPDISSIQFETTPPTSQCLSASSKSKPQALYTILLERMANIIHLVDCPPEKVLDTVVGDIEEGNHVLTWLSLQDKARLLSGLDLDNPGYVKDKVRGSD